MDSYQQSANPFRKAPNVLGFGFFFLPECRLVRCCQILIWAAVFWCGSPRNKQETENNWVMLHYFCWEDAEVQYSELSTTLGWWREPETVLASRHEECHGWEFFFILQRSLNPPNNTRPCSLHSAALSLLACFMESCWITALVIYTALFSGLFIKILSQFNSSLWRGKMTLPPTIAFLVSLM